MAKNVLLLGRSAIVPDDVKAHLDVTDVRLFSDTSLDDVRDLFGREPIHRVIMGAGPALDLRLQIVEHIFQASSSTTVHLKDSDSGAQGMLPFVKGIIKGLAG